jgi:hypothetical protein
MPLIKMDESPFRTRRILDKSSAVDQKSSPITPQYTQKSSDHGKSRTAAKLLRAEEEIRWLHEENQQFSQEVKLLKHQLTQAWDELSSFKDKATRSDASPRRETDYREQMKKLKNERNASNERYQRQVA